MAKRGRLLNIMAKRCRICLIDSDFMIKLHDKLVESKLEDLTRCTCIDIKYKNNLPDEVCYVCFYKLSMWAEFKELFIHSHNVLLKQLEKISEASNNAVNNSSENNRHLKRNIIEKIQFNESDGDNISPINKKKFKTNMSLPEDTTVNGDEAIIDTISISDSESTSSKDFSQEASDINRRKLNKNVENDSKEHMKKKSLELKSSKLSRGKLRKNKLRIAALKRWEARKKELCRSKRKNVSDSDFASSSDTRLKSTLKPETSTINSEEEKREKKMKHILKQLKTDLNKKYIGFVDVNTPRTRLRKQSNSLVVSPSEKNNIMNKTTCYSMNKESSLSSLAENNVTATDARKSISQTNNTFIPKLSQTKLIIGKTTFIVRSNLVLQDQQFNQALNSSKKNSEGFNGVGNGNSEEKNTDIIEAVQLRRVTPAIYDVKDNLERCLDIRIESKELAKLKRMQIELSNFIQREIKQKVSGENKKTDKNITMTDSVIDTNLQSKLDRNLKKLIQTAIERNIEHWIDKGNDAGHQGLQRVSPKLVKATAHLSQYQPKIVLERLDLSKHVNNNINIQNALKRAVPRNESPCKRLVVPPKKYDDFNTSFNSELSDSENLTSKSRAVCSRTYKNTTTKKLHSKVAIEKRINNSIVMANKDNGTMSSLAKENLTDGQKIGKKDIEVKNLTNAELYMCSICKSTFNNQKDIQTHILTSHTMTNTSRVSVMSMNNNTVTMPQPKQKKMRCKKCYEIVEYQSIKTHISTCKMTTQVYVCHVCDSNFNAKKLLFQHMETIHNMSQMTNTLEIKETNDADELLESRVEAATSTTSQESQTVGLQLPTVSEALQKGLAIQTNKEGICVMPLKKHTNETNVQSTTMDVSNIQSDKITATNVKSNAAKNVRKDQEYTCFLCDKVFTDEEMLKDHLQQHCDDLSDEEQNDNTHKCTICGNLLDSYKALEEHICKHWFDGEGSNDLNSVNLNDGNTTEDSSTEDEIHQCSECWEMFDSQSLLDMHTRVHVQEVPTAEPEEQVGYQYLCMLCDDLLDTEKDLADHINLHNGNAQICQLCDKPFHTLEELQEHVTTHL